MKTLFISFLILCTTLLSCKKDNKNALDSLKADFQISVDESFQIDLLTKGSDGGYRWSWVNKETITVVDSIDFEFKLDNLDPQIVGGGGTEIWKFKGKKSGIETIQLECKRPWDSNSTIETKKIIVRVK